MVFMPCCILFSMASLLPECLDSRTMENKKGKVVKADKTMWVR